MSDCIKYNYLYTIAIVGDDIAGKKSILNYCCQDYYLTDTNTCHIGYRCINITDTIIKLRIMIVTTDVNIGLDLPYRSDAIMIMCNSNSDASDVNIWLMNIPERTHKVIVVSNTKINISTTDSSEIMTSISLDSSNSCDVKITNDKGKNRRCDIITAIKHIFCWTDSDYLKAKLTRINCSPKDIAIYNNIDYYEIWTPYLSDEIDNLFRDIVSNINGKSRDTK